VRSLSLNRGEASGTETTNTLPAGQSTDGRPGSTKRDSTSDEEGFTLVKPRRVLKDRASERKYSVQGSGPKRGSPAMSGGGRGTMGSVSQGGGDTARGNFMGSREHGRGGSAFSTGGWYRDGPSTAG
jgi:hypothetical protein